MPKPLPSFLRNKQNAKPTTPDCLCPNPQHRIQSFPPSAAHLKSPPEKPLSKPPHPPKKFLRRSITITKEKRTREIKYMLTPTNKVSRIKRKEKKPPSMFKLQAN